MPFFWIHVSQQIAPAQKDYFYSYTCSWVIIFLGGGGPNNPPLSKKGDSQNPRQKNGWKANFLHPAHLQLPNNMLGHDQNGYVGRTIQKRRA